MSGFLVNLSENKIDHHHEAAKIIKHRGRAWSGTLQSEIGNYAISMIQHYDKPSAEATNGRIVKYEDGDCFIVFDGVIFNGDKLRNILYREGYSFKTNSDSELVLAAYCRWGNKLYKQLNGYFSFVIYHRRKNLLIMARDRFGVKPLYIYNRNKRLRITSEIKQLTKFDDFTAKVETTELYNFINQGKVGSNGNTLWSGVNELIPGYFITIRLNDWLPGENLYMQPYYKFQMAHKDKTNYEDTVLRLQDLLQNSIVNQIQNHDEIRILSSGGLGSAGLTGLSNNIIKASKRDINFKSYSWAWDDMTAGQNQRLQDIWKFNDIHGDVLRIDDNFLYEDLDNAIRQNDQPFTTPRALVKWHLMHANNQKISSDIMPILLHGHGIRELLMGYDQYYLKYLHKQLSNATTLSFIRKLNLYKLNSGSSWATVLKNFFKSRFAKQAELTQDDFLKKDLNDRFFKNSNQDYDLSADSVLRDGLVLLHDNLHCADHFSSQQGFEYRYPFLDNEICELALSINPAYKVSSKGNNRLLYDMLKDYVPETITKSIHYDLYDHVQDLIIRQQNRLSEVDIFKKHLELVADLPYVDADILFDEYHGFQIGTKPFNSNWLRMIFIAKWFEVHSVRF